MVSSVRPGSRIGPYAIVELLGQGGMGQVFRAKDMRLGREVAVKVLRSDRPGERRGERFLREIEAASRVTHPNIVRVHAGGEEQGMGYLVTDLVRGDGLDVALQRGGVFAPKRAAEIGAKLASALAALHAAGVLHRDLKPANVLLDELGEPRLTDFGLAKLEGAATLTKTGQLLGTPVYAPLEQLEGGAVDVRSDIYSLGALVYELVAGSPPFDGQDLVGTVASKMQLPAPPSSHRGDRDTLLDGVCARCLAPAPAGRFASAEELEDAFVKVLSGEKLAAPRRRGVLVAAASASLVLAIGGVVLAKVLRDPLGASTQDAETVLLRTVAERREKAKTLAALQLGDVAPKARPASPTKGYSQAWLWHGLSALARGDRATAEEALARVGGDSSPEMAALRGGLIATRREEARRGLPDLERALAAGVDRVEVRLWRIEALLARGGDRALGAAEALAELGRLRKKGVPLGPRADALEVEALVALERLDAATQALAAIEAPDPALAWSVTLLGVDLALVKADLHTARNLAVKAKPGARDAATPKRVQRVHSLLETPLKRLWSGISVPEEQVTIQEGFELLARIDPGETLPELLSGYLLVAVGNPALGVTPSVLIAAADLLPDDSEALFQIAYRLATRSGGSDVRAEAIARRAAAHGSAPHRLAARTFIVDAILAQERWADAIALADEVLGEVEHAGARQDLVPEETLQLRADLVYAKAAALRHAGHFEETLRLLSEGEVGAAIENGRPCEVAVERMAANLGLKRADRAFEIALETLRNPPNVGSRKQLAEYIWDLGLALDRTGELELLIATLDRWHLGDDSYWTVRRAIVAYQRGDRAKARDLIKLVRALETLPERFEKLEEVIDREHASVMPLLKELDHQLTVLRR